MSNFSNGAADTKPADKRDCWNAVRKLFGALSNETGLLVIDTEKDHCFAMSFFC